MTEGNGKKKKEEGRQKKERGKRGMTEERMDVRKEKGKEEK